MCPFIIQPKKPFNNFGFFKKKEKESKTWKFDDITSRRLEVLSKKSKGHRLSVITSKLLLCFSYCFLKKTIEKFKKKKLKKNLNISMTR